MGNSLACNADESTLTTPVGSCAIKHCGCLGRKEQKEAIRQAAVSVEEIMDAHMKKMVGHDSPLHEFIEAKFSKHLADLASAGLIKIIDIDLVPRHSGSAPVSKASKVRRLDETALEKLHQLASPDIVSPSNHEQL